jgi:hypothetical protein
MRSRCSARRAADSVRRTPRRFPSALAPAPAALPAALPSALPAAPIPAPSARPAGPIGVDDLMTLTAEHCHRIKKILSHLGMPTEPLPRAQARDPTGQQSFDFHAA